nr:NAD(P)-dependent oxidoreductase [Acanthopleuribacter pedis]
MVTGATGFIGGHLVNRLLEYGATVRVTIHQRGWSGSIQGVEVVPGDLKETDIRLWEDACMGCNGIFHLAAAGVTEDAKAAALLQQHVVGPAAMLEGAANVGVKGLVHTSSCFVYGKRETPADRFAHTNPLSPYAASKLAAETWLAGLGRALKVPVACARLFHVYGPGEHAQRLIPYVLHNLSRGTPLELTSGNQIRDFLYVADAVEDLLLLGAALEQHAGTVINLGTGQGTSVRDLVSAAQALFQTPGQARFGARPDRPDSLPFLVADAAETERLLGRRARFSLAAGLRATAHALVPAATHKTEANR